MDTNRPAGGSPLTLPLLPERPALKPFSPHETTQALRRAERLLQISQALNAIHDPDTLLTLIIEVAAEVLDCQAASILLYHEEQETLEFAATTGSDPAQLRQIPVPLEDSLAGTLFRENRPLTISDVSADTLHFEGVGQQIHFQTCSLLGLPMRIDGQVTGVLEALNKRHGRFTEKDTHALTIIATQAALAIRKRKPARLLSKASGCNL